ncbi:MAG: adenine-specific methyltransferase EcoRI family protein [Gammaproteobacteria bacterium]|nr:adenine-specific methyltransferase EcoRI family protein [Gammaproteobacteria bacterium]
MQELDMFGEPIIEPVEAYNPNTAHLKRAKDVRDDEFYTLRPNIDEELQHYEHHFKGKVVYCNCDDPATSQFVAYFQDNFDRLGLAELLTNHYDRETGTGDFMSPEAIAKLERSDIVVTNPPFSLFRHFITQLIEANPDQIALIAEDEPVKDKKFLILGGMNAMTYDCVFPLLQARRMWMGVNNKPSAYIRPDGSEARVNTAWFTNMEHAKLQDFVKTPAKFADVPRVKYDNLDGIECKYLKNLPSDYDGVIGVPITFMFFYNPAQFEVLGFRANLFIDGVQLFKRIIIRKVQP